DEMTASPTLVLSPAAETLYQAMEQRASGTFELVAAEGRRATVSVLEGDIVAAQIGYGFQSLAQILWRAGKLTLAQLDTLWSSGAGGEPDADALMRLGLDAAAAGSLRWRVQLQELVENAKGFQFLSAPIPQAAVILPGPQAVRAACEAAPPSLEGHRLRVKD